MPLGSIGEAGTIAAGEDGVDFVEFAVGKRRNLHGRLRFRDHAAVLGKINRVGRPEDPVLVDGMDGFHAG